MSCNQDNQIFHEVYTEDYLLEYFNGELFELIHQLIYRYPHHEEKIQDLANQMYANSNGLVTYNEADNFFASIKKLTNNKENHA